MDLTTHTPFFGAAASTASTYTVQGTISTVRYIVRYWKEINMISQRPSARTLLLSAAACYGLAELAHYWKFVLRYHRFNGMRVANHTREQVSQVADQWISRTPGIFQRLAWYSATKHMTDKESMVDAMCVDVNANNHPATRMQAGSTTLFRQYRPVLFHWVRRTLYHAGTIAMRRVGYVARVHATEIGDYTVWSRTVPDTDPIVMFPGFGLGAVPYHGVVTRFGRTVHIIEIPNLGHNTPTDAPGYLTSDTVYRVVRAHVGDGPHDIVAHSLGTSAAAHYINRQHTRRTTPPGQKAAICDGVVCPVDGPLNHIYPFVDYPMYREMMCHRAKPFPRREFSGLIWLLVYDFDVQVFTKRFHNFYDGTLWRDDYETSIQYVFSERDILYDVPYIKGVVSDGAERETYLFIPKARYGACFFGSRGMLPPATPSHANLFSLDARDPQPRKSL
jgi:pimeloyl-ACP methyl ester carboxylesterase